MCEFKTAVFWLLDTRNSMEYMFSPIFNVVAMLPILKGKSAQKSKNDGM